MRPFLHTIVLLSCVEIRGSGKMDSESFRRDGHRLIDWIAEYLAHPERYPVLAQVEPGQVERALPKEPPEKPEPLEAILQDMEKIIVPGLTHWNHPGFFAYFAISGSEPGILGELLSAAFNVNAMLWRTAPAATELEELVLSWLRQLLGLPPEFMGLINDTASVSSLCAIAAAREALGFRIREEGLAGRPDLPHLRLYTSEQAHSSVEKAAIVLGLGQAGVKKIAVDNEFRLRSQDLEDAIKQDLKAGWKPFCVVATVGTTSTTSVDPVPEIARICGRYKLWLHVDAAYAGAAAILPEKRWALAACERADSIVVNPHKWLFVPIDCSAFYCRQPSILRQAFSLVPEYLRTSEDDRVRNLMDYGIQLGRRFRALKLWMVLRAFGSEGLRQRLRAHIALAQRFQDWIEGSADFELLAPVLFSVVCFRNCPRGLPAGPETEAYLNRLNEQLLESVNRTGEVFLSHTELNGRFTLRLAIGNLRTTEADVRRAWALLQEHATRLDARLRPAALK
jgi:aromatic-L-amino-acid decarboxylase